MKRTLAAIAVVAVLSMACAGGGGGGAGSGVPSTLHGEWYAADGRRIVIERQAIGPYTGSGIDGNERQAAYPRVKVPPNCY